MVTFKGHGGAMSKGQGRATSKGQGGGRPKCQDMASSKGHGGGTSTKGQGRATSKIQVGSIPKGQGMATSKGMVGPHQRARIEPTLPPASGPFDANTCINCETSVQLNHCSNNQVMTGQNVYLFSAC